MHQITARVFGGFRGVILRLDWAAAERQWLMLLIGVAGTGRGMGLTGVVGEVSSRRTRIDIVLLLRSRLSMSLPGMSSEQLVVAHPQFPRLAQQLKTAHLNSHIAYLAQSQFTSTPSVYLGRRT